MDQRRLAVGGSQHARVGALARHVDRDERLDEQIAEQLRVGAPAIATENDHVRRPLAEVVETPTEPARAATPMKCVRMIIRPPPVQSRVQPRVHPTLRVARLH